MSSSTGEPWRGSEAAWLPVLGLLVSGAWEPWDDPDAAWLPVLGLLVSGAREPWGDADAARLLVLGLLVSGASELWEGPSPDWLAVLEPASSELALETVRGSKKVKDKASWGRMGQSGAPSPPGAERLCQAHPGHPLPGLATRWPQPRGTRVLCLLPVPRPAQLLHSQLAVLCFKLEQHLWVPSAAQEQHRSSCQGLGKQTG